MAVGLFLDLFSVYVCMCKGMLSCASDALCVCVCVCVWVGVCVWVCAHVKLFCLLRLSLTGPGA